MRAKRKIRDAGIPYKVPELADLPAGLDAVLTVIYLIFNEGYATTRGRQFVRTDLCAEAIRLGRLIRELIGPNPPAETAGLLALMLLHHSRREARLDRDGEIVLLDEQDRSVWNHKEIAEAMPLIDEAFKTDPGSFALQAAIAALHCTPVIALNRAAALAMADGLGKGLALIDELGKSGALNDYHLFHAARADLLRRAGAFMEASESYTRALSLVGNDSERRYLERRLREVSIDTRK